MRVSRRRETFDERVERAGCDGPAVCAIERVVGVIVIVTGEDSRSQLGSDGPMLIVRRWLVYILWACWMQCEMLVRYISGSRECFDIDATLAVNILALIPTEGTMPKSIVYRIVVAFPS